MKRFLWFGMLLLWAAPLWAATTTNVTNATDSLHFSTKPGTDFAWELTRSGSQWTLSFAPEAIVVDNTSPTDAKLQGDFVQLPTMTITGLTDRGSFLIATLNPGQSLTINSDTDKTAVFTASMKSGGMLAVGTNMVAYSQQDGDLDVKSFDKSYGVLVPTLGSAQAGGLLLDLSFSGDAIRGGNLFEVLQSDSGDHPRHTQRPDQRESRSRRPCCSWVSGPYWPDGCDRVPLIVPCAWGPDSNARSRNASHRRIPKKSLVKRRLPPRRGHRGLASHRHRRPRAACNGTPHAIHRMWQTVPPAPQPAPPPDDHFRCPTIAICSCSGSRKPCPPVPGRHLSQSRK